MSPQTRFHSRTMRLLDNALLQQAPEHLKVSAPFDIEIDLTAVG